MKNIAYILVLSAVGVFALLLVLGVYRNKDVRVTESLTVTGRVLSLAEATNFVTQLQNTNMSAPVILQTNSTVITIPRRAVGIEGLLVQMADYAYTIAILGGSRSDMTNAVMGALRGDITASTNWYKSSLQKTP